ncbi:MAG: hypothetical protein K2L11_10510 [Muribaculaceae bacterium]|nr:hypothetical protein [Muribaculaceae bacterium]
MKKISRIFLLSAMASIAAFSTVAQSDAYHIPRDGDRLHPGLAESRSVILSVNDSARILLLDPSAVSFDGDSDAWTYIDTDTISYVQFATKHRFKLSGDTLSYIGYENRATDFRLDRPSTVAVFPLKDGDIVSDIWTGHMLRHGAMMLRHVKGESTGRVESGWTLTDGTDTIRNVTRLRWTLDMAYADPDSVTAAMPDSVASEIISELQVDVKAILSERLLTERSMWFSEDARYPILTDSRVSRVILGEGGAPADTVPLSTLAIHYPASFQHSDTGEEFTAMKPKGGDHGNNYGEYGYDAQDSGSSLQIGEPEAGAGSVSITLCSTTGPTSATLTLFTDSGIRLAEPVMVTVGTVPQTCTVDFPAGWTGVLLIRVESGEESYTRKTII